MKIKNAFLFIAFIISYSVCIAQQNQIDSLKKIISVLKDDSNKVNALNNLSALVRNSSGEMAILYGNQAKSLAQKINYQKGLGYANKAIGMVYNMQGNYVNALQAWNEALKIFEANNIKVGIANMQNNIGNIYYSKSLEDKALDFYLKSLKVSEEIKDTLRIATALMNIGALYSNKTATYDKALEFYLRSLPLNIAIHNTDNLGTNYVNIGEIYLNISLKLDSTTADKQKDIDSSLVYLFKARNAEVGSPDLPYALNTIAKVEQTQKNFPLALQYQQMAFDTAKKFDLQNDMARALLGKAETYLQMTDYKSAIPSFEQAEEILKELGLEATYDLEKVYDGLSSAYADLNDFKSAFKYHSLLLEVKNKIYNLEVDKKLGTKLFTFEIDKKQGEINLQEEVINRQRMVRNGFMGGFAVVLLFAGIFFFQRNKIRISKRRSDELLLNILPESTAEELKATGTAKAKKFEMVSVMFTDFKNFTKASELLSAEELVKEIDYCFGVFDQITSIYGLEKIKTIGDSYMCASGLPIAKKNHAENIIHAGIEMQAFIERNKIDRLAKNQIYFELRVGIHSGSVVAGVVGTKKFAYDIWGDTVNTASRMESSGEVGKVNISGSTYELVKDLLAGQAGKFTFTYRGKIEAKSKGEIDMYFVS